MSTNYAYRNSDTRPRKQSIGIPVRFLIAGAIALFSVISYFSMGDENPITGETQRVAMSPDEEIALGLQAAPEMAQQHGGLHPDQQAQQHVDDIGSKLLVAVQKVVRKNNGENPFKFDFHLLADDKTVNAFALPGGQVFITAALYNRLETEGQLAGVIGHEIGHVLMRHGAQRMAKQKLTQGLVSATGVAGGGQQSAQMAAAVANMVNMKYGRDDELESDKWGVELCVEAGYDPRAMIQVMSILEDASGGGGPPEMMSTHPKPANRQAYIKDVIDTVYPNGLPTGLRP
ncbi:M48 family metalloprotease [Mariniblastus fucicola]|uniref:TPR repeat-containing protein YfgC n=1 Tax=Mariniblastus fucicola TaxID=980251 RepID=A0A5B9P221_9BACT|nr:M48 family metalloprotease [Mariniblastus fucicola]QEG20368.1 TPR repeat-containing protein YfgC precursor [Mariniblastus fucicola]